MLDSESPSSIAGQNTAIRGGSDSLPEMISVSLGDEHSMEFVLIQPGEFTMGLSHQSYLALPDWFGRVCFFGGLLLLVALVAYVLRQSIKTGRLHCRLVHLIVAVTAVCTFFGGLQVIRSAATAHWNDTIYSHALEQQGDEGIAVISPRRVAINQPFYMAKYEVTYEQFLALEQGVWVANRRGENKPKKPVVELTWQEASDYCKTLSESTGYRCRLPSEEEWEYACRAGTTTYFHAGNSVQDLSKVAWWELDTRMRVTGRSSGGWTGGTLIWWARLPGLKEPNAWGLYDMHGNAREWCLWSSRDTDKLGSDPYPGLRVARGGAWFDGPIKCLAAYRSVYSDDYIDYSSGFRPVIEIEQSGLAK